MTIILFGTLLGLLGLAVPIALSLVLASIAGLIYSGFPLLVVMQRMFAAVDSYSLMAIPFFVICGGLLEKGGVSKRLIAFANSLVGSFPGGLGVVCFVAIVLFGTLTGSAAATVAAVGAIMVPAMIKEGYPENFSLSTVASGGWLGIVLPPSIAMVVLGVAGNVSVSQMFIGGIIPGIILAVGMAIYAIIFGVKNMPAKGTFSFSETLRTLKDAFWAILMPIIILGGIYGGIFTPTEAAAVASLYGLIVGIFIYKELNLKKIISVMKSAVVTSGMVMFAVAAGTVFANVLTRELIPVRASNLITSIATSPAGFMLLVAILLLVVGMFMDTLAAILILIPILMPSVLAFGIEPVYFGVIVIILLGIGQITPPIGLCLFVAASLRRAAIENVICKHLFMYIIFAIATTIILISFPDIIMFLPRLMQR